ncbi:MAG: response regulator [Candidatus Hydrogenedentes bacterium]|nr:response regulator [Candidatus Hydrogenedentota bacterium]
MTANPNFPLRALVVSQNIRWKLDYTRILIAERCDVTTAARGFDALDMLRKAAFDLIVADESLDYLGLVEFALNLRDRFDTLPITLIAGQNLRHFDRIWQKCNVYYVGDEANLLRHLPGAVAEAAGRRQVVTT